jgi:hypothetical protein
MGQLRVRVRHFAGEPIGFVVERLADGLFYDPATKNFAAATPGATIALAPTPGGGAWPGVFRGAVDCSNWPDGAYAVYVFNVTSAQIIDGPLEAIIRNGDDAPYFAPGGGPKSWTLTPNP